MSDLAKRWAVAMAGIPAVVVLLYLGGWALAVPIGVLAALGALEVHRMVARGGVLAFDALGVIGALGLVLAAAWRPTFSAFAPVALTVLVVVTAATLLAAIAARKPTDRPLAAIGATLLGVLYVGLPMSFAPLLHGLPQTHGFAGGSAWAGLLVVALPLTSTWLGDAVALYAGTAWGKGGLAPSISPNKSWIGVAGGLVGAGVGAVVWYVIASRQLPSLPVPGVFVAGLVGVALGIAAVLGDLVESLMKRDSGVKDSGAVFPGHGGVLDRLDALIFTIPIAYLAFVALEAAR